MKTNISRRAWFRSTLSLTGGAVLGTSLVEELMAAPMSKAEALYWEEDAKNGQKVRLHSNENPYGPSDKAREAVNRILSEGNRYPFQQSDDLRAMLAAKEGVAPEYIHLAAGSGGILCQTGAAFGLEGGSVVSPYPTFPMLMNYAQVFKARWDKVDLNDKLEVNYEAIAAAVKSDTRIVFICNPNNPTGTWVDPARVKAFCEEVSKKVTVYSDEAYLEFMEPEQQKSMVELVKKDANIIVGRTFSKIYGLAGLRMGYAVARPDLINRISEFSMGIPINQAGLAAAKASLGDAAFMKLTRDKNASARAVLTDYLDKKKIFYGKSHINLTFFPAPKDGKTILAKMDEKGFLIRIWDYQQKEWCRVSIGTQEEMKEFVKAFDEVVS